MVRNRGCENNSSTSTTNNNGREDSDSRSKYNKNHDADDDKSSGKMYFSVCVWFHDVSYHMRYG